MKRKEPEFYQEIKKGVNKVKRIFCLVLGLIMLFGSSASAETIVGAAMDTDYYNVYISGKSELVNKSVTFLLIDDNNNPGYVREFKTGKNGEYELKFKFDANINKYKFMLRDTETARDISHTVKKSFAKRELYDLGVTLTIDGNDVIKAFEEGSKADVLMEIHNKYGNETDVNVLLASYDNNNSLLGVANEKVRLEYNDFNTYKTVEFKDIYVPAGTSKMKAFVWEDFLNLAPLAEADVVAEGQSKSFRNLNTDGSEWVVGIMGDSITHMGNYAVFLYHYYSTRYPDSNIKILNKGISGSGSVHQMYRLESEVLDPDDPFYGECDEIMLMIGMNDMGAWESRWPYGKLEDDEYLVKYPELQGRVDACIANVDEVVETCIEKGKKITLVTPSLHDEDESFATVFGVNYGLGLIAEGVKEIGLKYNVPVLDIYGASNAYSDRIRNEKSGSNISTIITGTDSTHPDGPGGYLLGYLFARAQETNDTVASVTVDALTDTFYTDNAEISDLHITSQSVSYTYMPKAIPLYAGSDGYKYVKNLGVDITNTMNKEIIKISNVEDGIYSLKMDGAVVGEYSADELAGGVNIAELAKNPGQTQSKTAFELAAELRLLEYYYRDIKFVEQQVVNYSGYTNQYYPQAYVKGTDFENYTDQDWYDTVENIRKIYEKNTPQEQWSNEKPFQWIIEYLYGKSWVPEYPNGTKKAEDTIIANMKLITNQ